MLGLPIATGSPSGGLSQPLKLTTIGVPWTSTWLGKGSFGGAVVNSHFTLGERTPAAITLMQFGSCAGVIESQGTQPSAGTQYVSIEQSSSFLHIASLGTQTPCEQISSAVHGM